MPHIRPGVLERLDVRLVVVADDFIRQARCALLSTPKEHFRGGRVAVLTREYVHRRIVRRETSIPWSASIDCSGCSSSRTSGTSCGYAAAGGDAQLFVEE